MRAHFLAVTLLAASTAPAFGLIGEDAKQIEARYGKPMQILSERGNHREVGYGAHGFMIVVDFVDGISQREAFARPDKSTLSSDAVQQILTLSAGEGGTWRDLPPKDGDRFWGRSDRKALAGFPAQGNFLFVTDVKYVQLK